MASEPKGVEVIGKVTPEFSGMLSPEALGFGAKLERAFGGQRAELLRARKKRQKCVAEGEHSSGLNCGRRII